jgi:glycerophosphoryl diester phosphodiesterase
MDKGENIVTLEDLLDRFNARTKKFIKELEHEEETERVETLDSIINEIKGQINYTKTQRARFINEIKSGLGDKIKENPTVIIKHNKPWYIIISNWFKNIFTKF